MALHASDVIFNVLIAVVLQIRALLDLMPCRWPGSMFRHCGGSCWFVNHDGRSKFV